MALLKQNKLIKGFGMYIEVAYQCELAQMNYDDANKEKVYVFGECPLKIKSALYEARKYGHGILMIINGGKVVRDILF